MDPFACGGALPLEAQRLGLVAHAADLNPVPVTINRAMIDIPARFCGHDPVHPGTPKGMSGSWPRATGLAEDVEFYANKMREMAKERIGKNYPDIEVTRGNVTKEATPIAYIWTRTVTCPNPACRHVTPLVRSFWLSKKKGHRAYIEPIAEKGTMRYVVHYEGDGSSINFNEVQDCTVSRKGAICLHCGAPISLDYIRAESCDNGLGQQLMALVSESPFGQGRWYSTPNEKDISDAQVSAPVNAPNGMELGKARVNVGIYGLTDFQQLFTNRQLDALVTFSDLVNELKRCIETNAIVAGMPDDHFGLNDNGIGARAYAEAVSVYLSFIIDKLADRCSSISTWQSIGEKIRNVFARQAIPMTWDFAEVNVFSTSSGSFYNMANQVVESIKTLPANPHCDAVQRDATKTDGLQDVLVSTDPPYYDNIDYADLSDFFYIWLRRSLKDIWPETFGTLQTPKKDELVATPYRFKGGKGEAKSFFENGMG